MSSTFNKFLAIFATSFAMTAAFANETKVGDYERTDGITGSIYKDSESGDLRARHDGDGPGKDRVYGADHTVSDVKGMEGDKGRNDKVDAKTDAKPDKPASRPDSKPSPSEDKQTKENHGGNDHGGGRESGLDAGNDRGGSNRGSSPVA